MAYGHITSLILIVDLVGPPKQKSEPGTNATRRPGHEASQSPLFNEWNDLALDAVFGLDDGTLNSYVCSSIRLT